MYVSDDDLVFGRMGGFGALKKYAAVAKFQAMGNDAIVISHQGYGTISCQIPEAARTGDDGKWGDETNYLFARVVKWVTDGCFRGSQTFGLPLSSYAAIVANGPKWFEDYLTRAPAPFGRLTAEEVDVLQQAWSEWKAAKDEPKTDELPPDIDPPTDDDEPPADDGGGIVSGDIVPGGAQRAGLGTLGWFLIGLAVVAVAGGAYYVATQKKPTRSTAGW